MNHKTNPLSKAAEMIENHHNETFCFPTHSWQDDLNDPKDKERTHQNAYVFSMIAAGGYIGKRELANAIRYIAEMIDL